MDAVLWRPASTPAATVLLIPGWGGGPDDVLGIAEALSGRGVAVVVLSPRGWHGSEGNATFANALDDFQAAVSWIRDSAHATRYHLTPNTLVLGGHSWGGGMSLAYAARDSSIDRVFSVAGTDHGQFIRQYRSDEEFAAAVDDMLAESASPKGPIRFSVRQTLEELARGEAIFGLVENAPALSDRDVLLIGGWDDQSVTVEDSLVPLYRALRRGGNDSVRFITYHANHSFAPVREDLHQDLIKWILR